MLARLRIASPSVTSDPPIQLAISGLVAVLARLISRSAVWVGAVMAWGVSTTSRPSLLGSSMAAWMAWV